jgi:hypothetical protein
MPHTALVRFVFAGCLAATLAAGCAAHGRPRYYGYSSWDIVRRDPCRYEEYRRFAARHENPEKRRRFVERLAREGCSLDRDDYRDRW